MYRVAWSIYAHSSITACADAVCGRTLPRHSFLGHPTSPFRTRRQRQRRLLRSSRIDGFVRHWCCRVIVEVIESAGAVVAAR
jgi:hypothetical protein